MNEPGDTSRVVYFDLDVKSWALAPPGVREARPACCPCCGAAAALPGGKVVLQGHGVRDRQRWGPDGADDPPEIGTLRQRRYRCTRCRAVVVVRPRAVLTNRRYTAPAIALALWLWAVELSTDAAVRAKTSVRAAIGVSRPERWTTLRRWAKAARDGTLWPRVSTDGIWTLRQCAERVVRVLAGYADVEDTRDRGRVFAAAARVG